MGFLPQLSMVDAMAVLLLLTIAVALAVMALMASDGSRPLLLRRMISRVGGRLDPSGDPLLGQKLASAARACSRCKNREACEALLASGSGDEVPDYCPNRRWIDSLAQKPA
jgi:hypothetical protein